MSISVYANVQSSMSRREVLTRWDCPSKEREGIREEKRREEGGEGGVGVGMRGVGMRGVGVVMPTRVRGSVCYVSMRVC